MTYVLRWQAHDTNKRQVDYGGKYPTYIDKLTCFRLHFNSFWQYFKALLTRVCSSSFVAAVQFVATLLEFI